MVIVVEYLQKNVKLPFVLDQSRNCNEYDWYFDGFSCCDNMDAKDLQSR